MAKRTGKTANSKEKDTTQNLVENISEGVPIIAWMEGKPCDLVFAFNPAYGDKDNPEDDLWHFLLPIEGELVVIRTGCRGYTPKGDLSELARFMMADPDRALDSAVEYPTITQPRKLKSMHLAILRI